MTKSAPKLIVFSLTALFVIIFIFGWGSLGWIFRLEENYGVALAAIVGRFFF